MILVVDDSSAILMVVSQMLTEGGFETVLAKDGQQAVDAIKSGEHKIDAILLDWNMPMMTGLEFLELNVAEKFTTSPIVMMTTENKPKYIQEALQNGAVEYIMKPFTQDIILSKLQAVLGVDS